MTPGVPESFVGRLLMTAALFAVTYGLAWQLALVRWAGVEDFDGSAFVFWLIASLESRAPLPRRWLP